MPVPRDDEPPDPPPSLGTDARQWGRIGCVGFGGPPTHIRLLRELCVVERRWLTGQEFEDAISACNLLPGPASTQLSLYCAWRVRGALGALVGGAAFILPGLVVILALAEAFLSESPPTCLVGAAAGAGSAVAAVALAAGWALAPASWGRRSSSVRWLTYAVAGALTAATSAPWLVVVLLGCGAVELAARSFPEAGRGATWGASPVGATLTAVSAGVLLPVAWVAVKVGALSYGGGFVIVPLMQADAVGRYHWMTAGQFLTAVALGQLTPGPVVQTVAVVGYAAAGLVGGVLASLVAFAPSFVFILVGARHFDRLRANRRAADFLGGSGPAAIGGILGSAVALAHGLSQPWQWVLLAVSGLLLLVARRGTVLVLVVAGAVGALAVILGAPLPR